MKRLLLAAILVVSFALIRARARAEADDAYGSLIGMADTAAGDRGPQAGEIPHDNPAMPKRRAENPAPYASGAAELESAPLVAVTASAPAAPKPRREALKDDDSPAVSVPPAAPPRVWTRLFASLLPSPARPALFEVELSTAPRRVRAKTSPHETAASTAGTAQGMRELVAAATAPTAP